jgi:hypothetical protein
MTIATNNDNDDVGEQFVSTNFATMACKRKKRNFFSSTLCFYLFIIYILFFTSSIDLAACSFDHLCREPAEMEIKK